MLNWLSIIAGFASGALWFYAAIIEVPTNIGSGFGKIVGLDEMRDGFKKQATLEQVRRSHDSSSGCVSSDVTSSLTAGYAPVLALLPPQQSNLDCYRSFDGCLLCSLRAKSRAAVVP